MNEILNELTASLSGMPYHIYAWCGLLSMFGAMIV